MSTVLVDFPGPNSAVAEVSSGEGSLTWVGILAAFAALGLIGTLVWWFKCRKGNQPSTPQQVELSSVTDGSKRKRNRWGDGLDEPNAGSRPFPHMKPGYKPSKTLPDSLLVFEGWDAAAVQQNNTRATNKVQHLANFGLNKHADHVAAVLAYTDETSLYGELNLTMRTKGSIHEKKLSSYGEYIYHLEQAINTCDNYAGKVYRGIGIKLAPHLYTPGTTITWQQFSSASKKQTVASNFVAKQGSKLSGSIFAIDSTKAKEIDQLSVFPEEHETLFGCNSHFRVIRLVTADADKKALLPDLAGYDLSDLDVYELKQL